MKVAEFELWIPIPSATAQQTGIAIRNGKPYGYKKQKVKDAEKLFALALKPHRIPEPIEGAIKLTIVWSYQTKDKKRNGKLKTTRPDLDNLNKIIQDSLVKAGFIKDDSQVAILQAYKAWTSHDEHIGITIERADHVRIYYDPIER